MNVFELSARLTLDTSGYEASLSNSQQKTSTFGDTMKKAFTTAAAVTALKKVGEAVYKIGEQAVSAYADYEQLAGGVETLFKSSASRVQKYAQNAYKTAGLSANDYMETVTSFSASLLQSLGNDTKAAAEYANTAMVDMSDNANKMGTDMTLIQNAYQGFAKQNYTMLDNLKLGYGGTKEEMERLLQDAEKLKAKQGEVAEYSIDSYADIVKAIHVVQTEMGITGTTSLEASETISGSMASAKASVENLLTGMIDTDQDIIALGEQTASAVATAFDNVAPAIANFMTVGVRALSDAVDPANKVSRAIGEIEGAQERVTNSNNILELVSRYKALQEQAKSSEISSSELADIEKELTTVRNQLATATGNAKIAQSESNDEVEQAVKYEEAMAQAEKERANSEIYKKVTEGAKSYKEELALLKTKSAELTAAEERLNYVLDDRIPAAQSLTDRLDELWESVEEGTQTEEELRAGLDELEKTIYDLTGVEVDFTDLLSAQDYVDGLDLSFVGLGETVQDAQDDATDLSERVDELTSSTEEFQAMVAALVDNGIISATEAASHLGVEVGDLDTVLAGVRDTTESTDEALEGLSEEEQAAQDATAELKQSLADIGIEAYNALTSGEDLRAKYEALTGQLESLDGELDQNTLNMVNTALETLNLAATNQELVNGYPAFITAAQNAGVSLSELSGWLISNGVTADEWGSQVSTAVDGVINNFKTVTTSTGQSVAEMKAALSNNIAAYSNWNSNIATLMAAAVASGDSSKIAFVQAMQDMGIGAANQVAEMVTDVDGTLDEFGPLFEDAADQGMLEVENSIEDGTPKATAAAESSMEDIQDAMEKVDFKTTGKEAISDVASGMSSETSTAANAATSVATSAKLAAGSVSFYSVGYNMDSGMASGVYGGSYLVSNAAKSAARSAYNAAKAALGIKSPSRLFRDGVGKMITEGISAGMQSNDVIRGLETASRQVADTAYDAFELEDYTLGTSMGNLKVVQNGAHTGTQTINNYINIDGAQYTDAREVARVVGEELMKQYRREAAVFA